MERIEKLKENFIATLSNNEDDNQELINSFEKFISDMISYLKETDPKCASDMNFLYRIVESRASYVTSLEINAKKAYLITDSKYEELNNISNKIYEKAIEKAEGKKVKIDEEKCQDIKMKLTDLLKQVKPFNKEDANNIYSETLLDMEYLSGKDIASLRIAHIIRNTRDDR